jgi:hypothetical protein
MRVVGGARQLIGGAPLETKISADRDTTYARSSRNDVDLLADPSVARVKADLLFGPRSVKHKNAAAAFQT